MINSRSRRRLALSVSIAALALVGCGSDDSTSAPALTTATTAASTAASTALTTSVTTADTASVTTPDTAADTTAGTVAAVAFDRDTYCSAEVALEMASSAGGDPEADPVGFATALLPLATAAQAAAPVELAANFDSAVGALQTVIDSKDPSGLQQLDTMPIHQYDASNCPWTGESVRTEDYKFVNLPDALVAGDYDFEVSNGTGEPHLLVILQKKDGVTASWDELLASPEGQSMVDTVAAGFAPPGGNGYAVTHLDAGEYLAVCPISQGSTGDAEGTGPPHFTLGMRQLITVNAG